MEAICMKLDRTDKRILNLIQENGRISNLELADKIGLSASPCSRRVKHLEDLGLIEKHVTLLDQNKLGLKLTAYLLISMDRHTPDRFDHFIAEITDIPDVMECCLVTGSDADFQLKVVVPDMEHYQALLLGKITRIKGVTGVKSSFMLRNIFNRTVLPLDHIK